MVLTYRNSCFKSLHFICGIENRERKSLYLFFLLLVFAAVENFNIHKSKVFSPSLSAT